jgi:HEAT repeat protein
MLTDVVHSNGEKSLLILSEWLASKEPVERQMAVIAVRYVEPPGAGVPLLMKALDDQSPYVQGEALQALAILGPRAERAVPKLQVIINTPDDPRLIGAIQAIGTIGANARGCADTLDTMASEDPRPDVRKLAAWASSEVRK